MTTIWIVWNQFQSHEYYLDCAKITNQSHEFYLECAFFTNQRREFYLDQLFYSALKSIGEGGVNQNKTASLPEDDWILILAGNSWASASASADHDRPGRGGAAAGSDSDLQVGKLWRDLEAINSEVAVVECCSV